MLSFSTTIIAQDITPFLGIWDIDAENNGRPGRGFQLDIQNDVMVLTFYGYEPSGQSTFYLASGAFTPGSNELTMSLETFAGGTAFGEPFVDAEPTGSAGNVTIRFSSMSRGEICLPDEPCKAISAANFGFPNTAEELLGEWIVVSTDDSGTALFLVFRQAEGNVASGTAEFRTEFGDINADVSCVRQASPDPSTYECTIEDVFGEAERFSVTVQRNALIGQQIDPLEDSGQTLGFRLKTASGRAVLPN